MSAMPLIQLPPLLPEKQIASLFLLPDCDMACVFCASERGFDVMSCADAHGVVDALAATAVRNIVFGGGEPLLWPHDLDALAGHARRLGFLTQVCTNGAAALGATDLPHVDRVILPLESTDAATHDALRRRAGGHHAGVLERLRALLDGGREVTLSTVVTARNIDHVARIGELLAGLAAGGGRIHAWHLYRFLAVGRGGAENANALAVDAPAYLSVCAEAKGLGLPFPVYRRDDMLRSSSVEFLWMEDGRLRVGSAG